MLLIIGVWYSTFTKNGFLTLNLIGKTIFAIPYIILTLLLFCASLLEFLTIDLIIVLFELCSKERDLEELKNLFWYDWLE